ncbi:MAG TPA: HTTM domain-containing protein [Thermoanaerobaculia bacterium]|nr:HTTM domain-containing protein [Thermoanaerobaculia bacterium]
MSVTRILHRVAGLRANARQLAAARILIGANAAFAAFEASRMLPRLLEPIVVKVPISSLVPVLPVGALRLFLTVWLLAAAAFALGWKTRAAGSMLALVTGYTLVLDQQTYSNHLYLLFLAILLLTISDSGAAWALDARHAAREEVAGWPILLLKIQVAIVYFFSAAAKITPEYLSGEILTGSLKQGGWLAVPESWRTPAAMSVLAAASIAAELFIAFGLWSPRLRLAAIGAGTGFHLLIIAVLDSSRLSLGIFALEMFAVYLLFVDAALWKRGLREKT